MKNLSLLISLLALVLLVSCNGGGGGVTVDPCYSCGTPVPAPDKIQSFVNLLNNRYVGDSQYYVTKRDTLTEGFVVVYSADTGYMAYDVKNYIVGDSWSQYSTYAEYQQVYINHTGSTNYGQTVYFGDAYKNNYVGTYAGEFAFDETAGNSKDLEKASALIDAHKASKMGEALSAEFGLSEERGLKVAKLALDWKKLSKSRSMTSKDADVFTKEVIGVDMKTAESAFKKHFEGDDSSMNDLIEKAADVNGTTPEHMNELFQTVFVQE